MSSLQFLGVLSDYTYIVQGVVIVLRLRWILRSILRRSRVGREFMLIL